MLVKARKGERNAGWKTSALLAAQVLLNHLRLMKYRQLWISLGYRFWRNTWQIAAFWGQLAVSSSLEICWDRYGQKVKSRNLADFFFPFWVYTGNFQAHGLGSWREGS